MANKEIDELTTASIPLDGSEQLHILQGGNSRELNMDELADWVGQGPQASPIGRAKFTEIVGVDWTAQDSGTPDTNAFQSETASWLMAHDGDDGQSWIYHSIDGSADFDVVMVAACFLTTDDFASAGFFVADGNETIGASFNYFTDYRKQYWTKPGTFDSNNESNSIDNHINNYPFGMFDVVYFRITLVGTTVTFMVSPNGMDWDEIFTANDTDWNMTEIDQVGLYISSTSVTAGTKTTFRLLGYDETGPQPQMKTGGGTLPVAFKGFRVTKSGSSQTPASFTDELVTFETVEHDSESGFNTTNDDEYIVPGGLDGKYMVFMAGIDNNAVADGRITIRQNGNNIGSNWFENAFYGQAVTPPVLVAEDDLIDVEVNMAAVAIQTGIQTFFGGFVVETSEDAFDYVEDTSTTRTLSQSDFKGNRTLEMNNASAITVTLDNGVTAAGPLTIIQGGAGQITINGTATLEASGSANKSNGQQTAMTLIPTNTADTYKLIGTITA